MRTKQMYPKRGVDQACGLKWRRRRGGLLDVRGPAAWAAETHEQPEVAPQVSHFMHVPLRTSVKLPHSVQASPT